MTKKNFHSHPLLLIAIYSLRGVTNLKMLYWGKQIGRIDPRVSIQIAYF